MPSGYVFEPIVVRRRLMPRGGGPMGATANILIVDPDAASAEALRATLEANALIARVVHSVESAYHALEKRAVDAVLIDLVLLGTGPGGLLAEIARRWPGTPVVVIAAEPSISAAVDAVRRGAVDFLVRPLDAEQLAFVVNKALTLAEHCSAEAQPVFRAPGSLLGSSPAMREAYAVLLRAAPGNATVLIRGESGTGKELVARALHEKSSRASGPFVKIDCAALPENLLESELFGYEKGAFTGAASRKLGRVELAHGGTLFLDEIGELTLPLQAKLLRLLQDRQLERLGGTAVIDVDVRIAAATHRDLESMTQRGEFRQDLFYRLNVVPIWLPPLRARRGDIAELARHFCSLLGAEHGKPGLELDDGALRLLRVQRWPGNVRQLQNFLERLVVLAEGPTIREAEVEAELGRQVRFVTEADTAERPAAGGAAAAPAETDVRRLSAEVRGAERRALVRALKQSGGNRTLAARLLGISRSFLYKKLEEHELV